MRKKICLLLCIAMIATMAAGCGKKADAVKDGNTEKSETGTYNIATNTWGQGAFPLDIIVQTEKSLISLTGMNFDVANNEFKADKVMSDLQNQIAAGCDGLVFLGIAQTMFPTAAKTLGDAKIPFAFHSNNPADKDFETIKNNPYFMGTVVFDSYVGGCELAKQVLKDGNKTAILSAAAVGDYSHDNRIAGFTKTFEEGGGKVLYVSHASDPSEAVQKANDFLTAYPDADALVGVGGDYVNGILSALEGKPNNKYKVYGFDASPDTAQLIVDGKVAALMGGQWVDGSVAMTLVINYLDGHQILDENGKAPCFIDCKMVTITPENAQGFIDYMKTGKSLLSDDEYKSLLYRYNPDVSYDTYKNLLDQFPETTAAKFQ